MFKKAIITISLVSEAEKVITKVLAREIKEKSQIPWCNNIEEIEIVDTEDYYHKLRENGVSEKVAENILRFYQRYEYAEYNIEVID
jgi:hypothetical protein